VSGLLSRLVYLSTGLSLILAFIGVKLILEFAHQQDHSIPELPTVVSLAVIVAVLAATTIASVIRSKRDPASRAHAGALRQRTDRDDTADAVPSDPQRSDEVRPVG
jgi:tellurite resistance protein TerC